MILLTTIVGIINVIKVVCVTTILVVSVCGKVIISAINSLFDYASVLCHGLGVIGEELRDFTIEQIYILNKLKTLIDNIFYAVIKTFCDLGTALLDFLFFGKVQTKAVVSSVENGIVEFFSLISRSLICLSDAAIAAIIFVPQTAYQAIIKCGEITHYSCERLVEAAVNVAKTVCRDIVSYSIAMITIFLILLYRRQLVQILMNLLNRIIRIVSFYHVHKYLK